ncbi:MAG: nitroreductase family protein [Clostridia bacterium]|nr:nitroreductase family protein [Clostridia bacterium]
MLNELVKQSRSYRSFRAGAVIPREVLIDLVKLAQSCPAAMNLQPLKYRLVTDEDELDGMLKITRWATSLSQKLPPEGHGPTGYIVICHDTTITPLKPLFAIDVGIAAQTMMLGACERGFGGCIIGSAKEEDITSLLGLPEHLTPMLILGLGVPEETVVLTEAKDGAVKYYRDESNVHYVPKRPLEELIL